MSSVDIKTQISNNLQNGIASPVLVGFLANDDPAAEKYAEWTAKTCQDAGISFELRKVSKHELEEKLIEANQDEKVNGIMIYYPVFGNAQVRL
jgi:methylenetetrahydrofolate dehydrogenase (NAD+)